MAPPRHLAAIACAAGACLCGARTAHAEYAVLLTTNEVLAVDLPGEGVGHYALPAELGPSVRGIERGSTMFVLADASSRQVWSVDEAFDNPGALFDLPAVNIEGIAFHGGDLVVNGQAPMVPPDTLYVVDGETGQALQRFPMPSGVRGLKDVTSDGTHVWGIDSAEQKLWRIDPTTGTFDLSYDLPGTLIFAVAWNPSSMELWVFQSAQQNDIVGYVVDRDTGSAMEAMRVTKAATAFVLAATFSDSVTPNVGSSWGSVKARFAR